MSDFVYEDMNDPVDLVLGCDDEVEEAVTELENDGLDAEEIEEALIARDILPITVREETELEEYAEEFDNALDIADCDAQDYREVFSENDAMEEVEDEMIDAVIDSDPDEYDMGDDE